MHPSTAKPVATPVAMPAGFSPLSLLRIVWLHKWIIGAAWLVGTAIAYVVVSRMPKVYKAEVVVLVESQKIPESYVASTVTGNVEDRLATITQQILSGPRLRKVIEDFNLYSQARKLMAPEEVVRLMRSDMSVQLDRGWTNQKPGAFHVGYTGRQPAVVAQVANRLANLYVEENLRARAVQAQGTAEFIDGELKQAKANMDESESKITAYKLKHNGGLPEQANGLVGMVSRLQMEQTANAEATTRAVESKAVLENTLKLAEAAEETVAQQPAPARQSARQEEQQRPVIVPPKPKKPSEVLAAQLSELQQRFGPLHPEIRRLEAALAAAKAEEAKEPEKAAAAPVEQLPPAKPNTPASPPPAPAATAPNREVLQAHERVEAIKNQIAQTDREIHAREAEKERITHELAAYQERMNDLPIREQEMAGLQRDFDSAREVYRGLLAKHTSADMASDLEMRDKSERFTIIDPATVPSVPVKRNPTLLGSMGSAGGLALGFVLALAIELRKQNLLGEWELPEQVTILGRVPFMRIDPPIASDGIGSRRRRRSWLGRRRLAVVSSVASALVLVVAALYLTHRL